MLLFSLYANGAHSSIANYKTKNAEKFGQKINFFKADIMNYEIETNFDIIFACGAMQYVPLKERARIFKMFQEQTNAGGLNVVNAIVEKSFVDPAPNWDENAFLYETAEIFKYYGADWKFELMEENYFDCEVKNIPRHSHCMDQLIARKILK